MGLSHNIMTQPSPMRLHAQKHADALLHDLDVDLSQDEEARAKIVDHIEYALDGWVPQSRPLPNSARSIAQKHATACAEHIVEAIHAHELVTHIRDHIEQALEECPGCGSPSVFALCDKCNEEFRLGITGDHEAGYCCAGEHRCQHCGTINRVWIRISMMPNERAP